MSDGGVWARSAFKKRMDDGLLNIPTNGKFPYHIVGDDAFPLSTRIMKPYPGKSLGYDDSKRIFNYRHIYLRSGYEKYLFRKFYLFIGWHVSDGFLRMHLEFWSIGSKFIEHQLESSHLKR